MNFGSVQWSSSTQSYNGRPMSLDKRLIYNGVEYWAVVEVHTLDWRAQEQLVRSKPGVHNWWMVDAEIYDLTSPEHQTAGRIVWHHERKFNSLEQALAFAEQIKNHMDKISIDDLVAAGNQTKHPEKMVKFPKTVDTVSDKIAKRILNNYRKQASGWFIDTTAEVAEHELVDYRTAKLLLGDIEINCKIADDSDLQVQGLQGHESLGAYDGMIFPYEKPRRVAFHMGKVSFPIDMIFVAGDSRVSKVVENIEPGQAGQWAMPHISAVIEVNGGFCQAHDIRVGTEVRKYEDIDEEEESIEARLAQLDVMGTGLEGKFAQIKPEQQVEIDRLLQTMPLQNPKTDQMENVQIKELSDTDIKPELDESYDKVDEYQTWPQDTVDSIVNQKTNEYADLILNKCLDTIKSSVGMTWRHLNISSADSLEIPLYNSGRPVEIDRLLEIANQDYHFETELIDGISQVSIYGTNSGVYGAPLSEWSIDDAAKAIVNDIAYWAAFNTWGGDAIESPLSYADEFEIKGRVDKIAQETFPSYPRKDINPKMVTPNVNNPSDRFLNKDLIDKQLNDGLTPSTDGFDLNVDIHDEDNGISPNIRSL